MKNTDNTQTKHNPENNAKQYYPGLVTSYDTQPQNEVGLFYNATKHTQDTLKVKNSSKK